MVTCVVFFKVVQAVHFVQVNIQCPEALGDHTRPGVQNAPEVRLGQLLPVVKGGRTLQGERAGEGGDREKRGLGQESKLMALHHPPVRSASPGGPGRCRWTQEGTPTELPCPPPAVCQAPTPFHAQKEHQSQSKNPFFLTK